MVMKDIIRSLRQRHNLTQDELGEKLGISGKTVSSWEVGNSEPRMGMVEKLAIIFGVKKSDIIGETESKTFRIPILGRVPAGIPIEAIEEIIDWEEISNWSGKESDYFGLKIVGDSMEPKISDGDYVIMRKQPDVESGETAIVIIDGRDATCKKVLKNDDGIILAPTNSAYEPTFYSWSEIKKTPVNIIGKVVELRAKF